MSIAEAHSSGMTRSRGVFSRDSYVHKCARIFVCSLFLLVSCQRSVIAQSVTTAIPAGNAPIAVAVNPVTNKIYVPNFASFNVTVIDGATNITTTVPVGSGPNGVAVNPLTNKIYVINENSYDVTVIDGASNATSTVPAGLQPAAIAVNPVTNKIYVANGGDNTVTVIDGASTVIDGASKSTATVTLPGGGIPILVLWRSTRYLTRFTWQILGA